MLKRIILIAIILIFDLSVYLFLGLMMMNYEDFYTPEKGPWYSIASMSKREVIIWFAYQGWIVLNIFVAVFLVYKLIKWRTTNLSF